MPIYPYRGVLPRLGERVFLAPSAELVGDVEVGDDASFWFHTVVRGDVNSIRIGPGSNVQDGAVLHVTYETHPLVVGAGVSIAHGAVVHGCTLGDGALVGIGARVLDGAVVEAGAQIGAGAVVAPGKTVPAGHLALGVPARVVRPLSDGERRLLTEIRERYRRLKEEYRAALGAAESTGEGTVIVGERSS